MAKINGYIQINKTNKMIITEIAFMLISFTFVALMVLPFVNLLNGIEDNTLMVVSSYFV